MPYDFGHRIADYSALPPFPKSVAKVEVKGNHHDGSSRQKQCCDDHVRSFRFRRCPM